MITVDKIESPSNNKADKKLEEAKMYDNNKTVSDSVSQGSSENQILSDKIRKRLGKAENFEIGTVQRELFEINVIDDSIDYKIGNQIDHNTRCQFTELIENFHVNKNRRFGVR